MKSTMKIIMFMCIILVLGASSFALNINLISPKDDASTNQDYTNYGFTFKYNDLTYSTMSCELLIDSKSVASNENTKKNIETTLYSNTQYNEGIHYYEVRCSKDKIKNSSEIKIFTYDLTPPSIQLFRLDAPVSCVANDTIDNQVTVSVTIIDKYKKIGTCKAIDESGNYVIVDQDLKIIEKSATPKQITPVKPVETAPIKEEETATIVEEVAKTNITEETKVNTTIEEIPVEEAIKEIPVENKTVPVNAEIEKKEDAPLKEVVKTNDAKPTPKKWNFTVIGISLFVLIIASILAVFMFRKDNEVVIIK